MITNIEESPLYRIADPRNLAFYGASNSARSMGSNLLMSTLEMGYKGTIYPIHPKEKEVQGFKAYTSILDAPEIPDAAVMVLPTKLVNSALDECGRKGVKSVIIVTAGFKEVGGDGPRLQKEIEETADKYGIRILGPNCIGVANPHKNLNTTFVPYEGKPGFIGLASQSGSFVTQMFNYLSHYGLGFSTAFSVGNEANIDIVDGMEYLALCPNTKVIGLYIEGIKRGREFVDAARAIAPDKPIVALYVGGSETGKKAGFSHTGSLAGPDELYEGVFRQSGIIRAHSINELFDYCWVLGSLPLPRGNRAVVQTNSGGPGAAAADSCGRAGLDLPPLSAETIEKLSDLVPHTGSLNNPVDVTFSRNPQDFYTVIPEILLQDPNVDMLMPYYMTPDAVVQRNIEQMGVSGDKAVVEAKKVMQAFAASVLKMVKEQDKPIVGYSWRDLNESFTKELIDGGFPVFPDAQRAARAMGAMVHYKKLRDKILSAHK